MSKYKPLWVFLECDGSDCLQLSFSRIEEILNFPLDHSFLNYKKELLDYGYEVKKISMKQQWVLFERIQKTNGDEHND